MKSRSAIMTAPGEPLLIDEIDVPDPGPNQVIVKQTATGICASQIHELTKIPEESCPCVLGHEGVGVVTHVGKDVTHLQEGDWAITTWVPRAGYPGGISSRVLLLSGRRFRTSRSAARSARSPSIVWPATSWRSRLRPNTPARRAASSAALS